MKIFFVQLERTVAHFVSYMKSEDRGTVTILLHNLLEPR